MNPVPGITVDDQARALAGALAEMGVRDISDGGSVLKARETDLPGLLVGAAVGARWQCPAAGIELVRTAQGLAWRAVDRAQAERFSALLNRT